MNYASVVLQFFPRCPLCGSIASLQVDAGPLNFRDSMRCSMCGTEWHLYFGVDGWMNPTFDWAALETIGPGSDPGVAQMFSSSIGSRLAPPQWFQIIAEIERMALQEILAESQAQSPPQQYLQSPQSNMNSISAPTLVRVKCRSCGGLSPEDAAFCSKCGGRL